MSYFTEEQARARRLIAKAPRVFVQDEAVEWNTPFEYTPAMPPTRGILLIHGLLDSPFQMRELGLFFQEQGFLVRALLLPGHGTTPADLISCRYQEWQASVAAHVQDLKKQVNDVFIVGNSTGGSLAIDYAHRHPQSVKGLILISPAIKIKSKLAFLSGLMVQMSRVVKKWAWLHCVAEDDCVKYRSFPINAAYQVYLLSRKIKSVKLAIPQCMILSANDETIDVSAAMNYFKRQDNPHNRMLYFSNQEPSTHDPKIIVHPAKCPAKNIHTLSHVCLPIHPDNPHYGEHGTYTRLMEKKHRTPTLGAVNELEETLKTSSLSRLYFNPWFSAMVNVMKDFINAG